MSDIMFGLNLYQKVHRALGGGPISSEAIWRHCFYEHPRIELSQEEIDYAWKKLNECWEGK